MKRVAEAEPIVIGEPELVDWVQFQVKQVNIWKRRLSLIGLKNRQFHISWGSRSSSHSIWPKILFSTYPLKSWSPARDEARFPLIGEKTWHFRRLVKVRTTSYMVIKLTFRKRKQTIMYLKNQRSTRRQKTTRTEISWKDSWPRAAHLLYNVSEEIIIWFSHFWLISSFARLSRSLFPSDLQIYAVFGDIFKSFDYCWETARMARI